TKLHKQSGYPIMKITKLLSTLLWLAGPIASTGITGAQQPETTDPLDDWHVRNQTPTSDTFYGASYGTGRFVAIGSSGIIFSSPDGQNWTEQASGFGKGFGGIAFGQNMFVAVGDAGAVFESSDGQSWSNVASGVTYELNDVVFG